VLEYERLFLSRAVRAAIEAKDLPEARRLLDLWKRGMPPDATDGEWVTLLAAEGLVGMIESRTADRSLNQARLAPRSPATGPDDPKGPLRLSLPQDAPGPILEP
jgi:hypothetical protein